MKDTYEARLEVIERMVRNGYVLMNRTAEELARTFTLAELERFEATYNYYLGIE